MQRLLNAGPDTLPERAFERPGVGRNGANGGDHLVGDRIDVRPQHDRDVRRKLLPGLVSHNLYEDYNIVEGDRGY
jgi:hypothetical protein